MIAYSESAKSELQEMKKKIKILTWDSYSVLNWFLFFFTILGPCMHSSLKKKNSEINQKPKIIFFSLNLIINVIRGDPCVKNEMKKKFF